MKDIYILTTESVRRLPPVNLLMVQKDHFVNDVKEDLYTEV